jgi:stearoyl-CoA 9-desaturase NADPH oxidoreductase
LAERGAPPKVPKLQRRILQFVRAFTNPLLPDDYLELINPLWSTRELRGRIREINDETEDAATIVIEPSYEWEGHEPGQYLRIGLDIDGRRHWRAYSLTSDPRREDGCISITVKHVEEGTVSPFLVRKKPIAHLVGLGGVEGDFLLPDPVPEKILFISAGSGITPIMSMLRSLDSMGDMPDVVHLHSAQTKERVIFGEEMRGLAEKHDGFFLHEQHTSGDAGRLKPGDLEKLCPDWKERIAYISGPPGMLEDMESYWEEHGDMDKLNLERFQSVVGNAEVEEGEGGTIKFLKSDTEAESDGSTTILDAGEEAGLELDYGCREGICHTCVGTLKSGQIRDLRTGKVSGDEGETIRICINAPEGPVEIDL